jgi:preprotein translocase subunit SecF
MKFREIIKNTHIDFIGMRNKTFMLSCVLLIIGCIAFVIVSMGKANLSVDFTGGTSLHLRFQEKVSIGDLRNALAGDIHDVQIQEVSGTANFS